MKHMLKGKSERLFCYITNFKIKKYDKCQSQMSFLSWATSKENRLENQNPILNLHFFAFYNSQGSEKLKIK